LRLLELGLRVLRRGIGLLELFLRGVVLLDRRLELVTQVAQFLLERRRFFLGLGDTGRFGRGKLAAGRNEEGRGYDKRRAANDSPP
jgi:hypothetical protein